jgi:pilus assembly protein CpaF
MILRRNNDEQLAKNEDDFRFEIAQVQIYVQKAFQEIINASPFMGNPSAEEYSRRKNRRKELRSALRSCMLGDQSAKNYVKSYMKDLLLNTYGFNETNINLVIPFDRPDRLTDADMFDILLYVYQKTYKRSAFVQIVEKYELDKMVVSETGDKRYVISSGNIRSVYEMEKPKLSFDEKLDLVIQRVYQHYKGLGVADELRDQNVDGVSGGTSGIPESVVKSLDIDIMLDKSVYIPRSYDSVWVYYKAKPIHLEFLSFGSEKELKRVCQNIYTFGSPGQLSESKGYMVNDMADGSRVLVVRPKMAESWAFIVRKHPTGNVELPKLVRGKNANIPINLLIHLVRGKQTLALTGAQGSGKSTLLRGLIGYIYVKNIRIQEMFFEIWARKVYPLKNILTFRETPTNSAQEGINIGKKSEGAVGIVGEAADHETVSLAIQQGTVASEFTLVTHHAKTFEYLVSSMRNSLIATGFSSEKTAEEEVVNWLGFNVHMSVIGGERRVARVTECIPVIKQPDLPKNYLNESTIEGKLDGLISTFQEFVVRTTSPKTYEKRDILIFEDGEYKAHEKMTVRKYNEILENMDEDDQIEFKSFIKEFWGGAA